LIASELFGHEKGAFTGATQRRLDVLNRRMAEQFFLDEIGDLPADIQIALLRVLQEREIDRIGARKPIPVDVRILAATHRDLTALAAEGRFRQDLLYRLNVVPIKCLHYANGKTTFRCWSNIFIGRFGNRVGKKFRTIDKKTLELFKIQLAGHIRELQNVIERAVILSEGDSISIDEAWLTSNPRKFVIRELHCTTCWTNRKRNDRIRPGRNSWPSFWSRRGRGETWHSNKDSRLENKAPWNQQISIQRPPSRLIELALRFG